MRVFTAALATETNTFSPIFIDRRGFEGSLYAPPGQHPGDADALHRADHGGAAGLPGEGLDAGRGDGRLGGPGGARQPGDLRVAARRDPRAARARRCRSMRWCSGCTGRWSRRATTTRRATCSRGCAGWSGRTCCVCAELDPHSHLTAKRVAAADFFTVFKEFPHTDFVERAEDLWRIAVDTLEGRVRPVMSVFDCRMIDVFPTSREPMRGFVDRMLAIERDDPLVLSLSAIHGFMAGRRAGDGDEDDRGHRRRAPSTARRWRERLGMELFANRGTAHDADGGRDGGGGAGDGGAGGAGGHRRRLGQSRRRDGGRCDRRPARADGAGGRGRGGRDDLGSDGGAALLAWPGRGR